MTVAIYAKFAHRASQVSLKVADTDNYNLMLIYDAAHAFGVEYEGKSIFAYGNVSVASFYATKVLNIFSGRSSGWRLSLLSWCSSVR